MRTPLVCTLRVTISPWSSLPDFLKEPMLAMSLLLAVSNPRPSRPRWRSFAGGDRRRTRSRAGAARRMAAERLSCLARNGRSPGEESRSDAVAAQAIEATVLRLDQAKERPWVRAGTASSGEDVADLQGPAQEHEHRGRREGGSGVEKGRNHPGQ